MSRAGKHWLNWQTYTSLANLHSVMLLTSDSIRLFLSRTGIKNSKCLKSVLILGVAVCFGKIIFLSLTWGLDMNQATLETKGGQSISMVIGSQSNRTFLENDFLSVTGGGFDVIIDDGGHHFEQQSLSYQVLFEKALKPGGWYIIEDIETSFWGKGQALYGSSITRGGCEIKDTMFRAMQRLTEVVNKKFIDNDRTVFGSVDHWVKSIMFGSNIVILQKKDEQDCFSENLYTWPNRLANDCPAALQANRTSYPPEKFTLHAFCSTVSD